MDYDERLNLEIINEEASLWFSLDIDNNPVAIVKAPINTIKAIVNGCRTQFVIGVDRVHKPSIAHIAIKIFDFEDHPMVISGANRFKEENIYLQDFLSTRTARVVLYNELGICVASGSSVINTSMALKAIEFLGELDNLYSGEFTDSVTKSLDCFDFTLDPERDFPDSHIIDTITVDCSFQNWNDMINHLIGLNDEEEVKISNHDEGATLESHIWYAIENLFHFNVHLNPQFSTSDGKKELTDILAFHQLGIFLFESKCLSIFSSKENQSVERKVKTLQKHISKAIRQLIGAKKTIQSRTEVFTKSGALIDFDRDIVPHCVILVAELIPFGDWLDVELAIMKATTEENIYLHVMDFREFMNFVKNSNGKKEYFDYLLMKRAESFIKAKSIHMRSKFKKLES